MDFLQDLTRNLFLALRQLQMREKFLALPDGQFRHLMDVLAADGHGKRLRLKPCPVAGLAGNVRHIVLIRLAHLVGIRFFIAAGQKRHHALKGHMIFLVLPEHIRVAEGEPFPIGTMQQHVPGFPVQLLPRGIQGIAMLPENGVHRAHGVGIHIPRNRGNGAVPHGKCRIRQYQLLIELHMAAEARTLRTRPIGIIEGKHTRRDLGKADAAVHAGKVLAEHHELAVHDLHIGNALSQLQRRLHRVCKPLADALAHHEAVNDHLDGMLLRLFQPDLIIDIMDFPIHPYAHIALMTDMLQHLPVLAFFPADDLRHDQELRALRDLQHLIQHLIHALLGDGLSAFRTVRTPGPRKEQAQIVIDFRDRPHRRAGIVARGLLVDGNGRRKPLDIVHIRLVHLP